MRSLNTAVGESTKDIPHVVDGIADVELAGRYGEVSESALAAWRVTDGLAGVVAPWGAGTAWQAVCGFTVETLVHGWDLAVATGREREHLVGVATRALAYVDIPDRLRGWSYAHPIIGQDDAGPTTALARRLGRAQ